MSESIQYTKSINFDYSPYDEDLVVTGAKGSRKTSLVRDEILPAKISNCAYWIWDFSSKFHGWGNLVDNGSTIASLFFVRFVFILFSRLSNIDNPKIALIGGFVIALSIAVVLI